MGCACTTCKRQNAVAPDDFSVVCPAQPDIVVTPADAQAQAKQPDTYVQLDTSKGTLPLQSLPNEVKLVLFRFITSPDFVGQMSLVCRGWHAALVGEDMWHSLWKERLGSASVPLPAGVSFLRLVVSDPLRNLLSNPVPTTLADHQRSWRIVGEGGKALQVEEHGKAKYWVAARAKVHRKQVVNLEGLRLPAAQLFDQEAGRPDLWIGATWRGQAANSTFRLRVRLMGAWQSASQNQEVLATYDSGELTNNTAWQHHTHCFRDYGRGVRYVCFEDWAKDASVAGSCVQLYFAPTAAAS